VAFTALAYAMNDEFSRVLHQQMEYFSSKPNADAINRVKGEISEVWYSSLPRHSLEVSFFFTPFLLFYICPVLLCWNQMLTHPR
jgi:hypothetical protein